MTLVIFGAVGCTSISIAPSCPEELAVGESGEVAANEVDPGAIPTYKWEVFPPGSGTFADASQPVTTFEALEEGEVVIRLTASDGLYQMISACTTRIRAADDDGNGNENENDNDNANDDAIGNDNTNDNVNDNGGDNTNDNNGASDGGGRRGRR